MLLRMEIHKRTTKWLSIVIRLRTHNFYTAARECELLFQALYSTVYLGVANFCDRRVRYWLARQIGCET